MIYDKNSVTMSFDSKRSMTVDKAKIHVWAVFVALFLSLFFQHAYAHDLERNYSVRGDFRNLEKRTFVIEMDATITNHTQTDIAELLWMLYPNRFLKELPNLNDLNYRRIYPNGFSEGYLKVKSLKIGDDEISSRMEPVSVPPIPENTLYSLKLDQPLAPGQTQIYHFVLELKVPKKFGSFGFYEDRLTMSGGWTPYLVSYRDGLFYPTDQSPVANWEVKILSQNPYVVGSEMITPDGSEKTFTRENVGQFPIQIGTNLTKKEFEHNGIRMQAVVDERTPEKILGPLKEVFDPWTEYVQDLGLDSFITSKELAVLQAPLREMLAVDAQDVSFFSDRAYKVIEGLQQFHNVPLVRMMFSQLFFGQTLKKENSRDYCWVNEIVANQLTENFLATQHYRYRDARKIGAVRFFSVLPLIDQIIHTPQFAFFDVFYNFVYPFDPVRDEFSRFQHRRQYGHSVLAHMLDELGEKVTNDIILDYIHSPNESFLQVAEKITGQKLAERFEHWTSPRPELNYRIQKLKSKKTKQGYENLLTIDKETNKPMQEPVEIKINEKSGKKQTMIWDSKETEHTFEFSTESKVKTVEIDPRQRLLETKLSDNRTPPYWKFVLTQLFAQYDFNSKQPDILIESQLRKKYGGQDRYLFGGFYQVDSYGLNVGYVRLFGQALDRLRLSHGLGLQYSFSRLAEDDVFVNSTPTPTIYRVTDPGFVTSVTGSYFFGNQLSYTNPLQGEYGGASFTYGSTALGGDFHYYQVALNGSKIFQLHPSHLLAFRGYLANSGPDSMPTQVEFRLGGLFSMRGLGISQERYIGRNMLLLSGEYRHFLIQDCDVNLWLFRVRDIQGALFVDGGRVTDTVQEKADQAVFGASSPATTLADVFKIQHFQADTGYGLRFFVDYLGVSPGLVRLDLAKSLTDDSQPYRFYFGVTQSF